MSDQELEYKMYLYSTIKIRGIATVSMTREDMKNKIGQACSKIMIEQLIKVRKTFQQKCDYAYNKKVNISNIYWIDAKNFGKNVSVHERQEDLR